jgi:iron complex transport system substrate-binding protein
MLASRLRGPLALLCALFAVIAAAADPPPQRIASLNLCTDQLLLLLLPRERIASVTEWAQKPERSYMAAAAQGLPVNYGLAERVLPQQPDLILAGEYNDHAMVAMMRQLGYRVEVVRVPRNLDEAHTFILEFGALVGAQAQAQALVADMQRRLARIADRVAGRPAGLAAVYSPNGMSAGRDTVMEEILARAGWRNLGSEIGLRGYGQLPLERLIQAQPDLLVLDTTAEPTGGASLAHAYLSHPALASLPSMRQLVLPPPLSVCVGPMTIDAIEKLVAAR